MDAILFGSYEVAASVVPCLFVYGMKQKDEKKGPVLFSLLTTILFALYVIAVYHVTGVGTVYDVSSFGLRSPNISLLPFSTDIDILGYFLNILMLVPFGFFLPLMRRSFDSPLKVTLMGALFSVFIESAQLLNYRVTDIDDVFMNAIGAYCGYLIFRLFRNRIRSMQGKRECPAGLILLIIITAFAGRFLLYNIKAFAELLSLL